MSNIDIYETQYNPKCRLCHGSGYYHTEQIRGVVVENNCDCYIDYENPEMTLNELEAYQKEHGIK